MLEIDPKLLLLTVVVFLALIYVLNAILIKPILGFVDNREAGIKESEQEVAKYGTDIKKYEEEAAKILASAREEVIALKNAAIKEASQVAKEKLDAKRAELEKDYKEFEAALKAEHDELKDALRANLPIIKASLQTTLAKL